MTKPKDIETLHQTKRQFLTTRVSSVWGRFECLLGKLIPVQPSLWSWLKVIGISPLVITLIFTQPIQVPFSLTSKRWLVSLFVLSLLCDALRRARITKLFKDYIEGSTPPPQITLVDRFSDLPLSLFTTYWLIMGKLSSHPILVGLVITRLALEVITSICLLKGRGPKGTRLRTVISELSLYVLLCLVADLHPHMISPESSSTLIALQVVFSSLIFAYQLKLLQKRFIADSLSGLNFICGLVSIYYATHHHFDLCLLFLLLGGAFDGFDGAAARKFGGTRFGVYSDDIADGMNYGIAPAYAVYQLMGGVEGLVIGTFYALFTLSRLVYFTLNKDVGDPSYFSGVPSPVGGMMVMSSVVLFVEQPLWVSFIVGVSATLMVSFRTPYVHIFRALGSRSIKSKRQALLGAPLFLIAFLAIAVFGGPQGAAAVILVGATIYGFIPSILSFYLVLFSPEENETASKD